ncbi:MAG TPA: aldose epimerase family protein [Planctomycetota bacterium]|nr:aldose epimerase family protein [Planctomycetota bacterium]
MSAPRVEDWGLTAQGERGLLFTLEGEGIRARISNFGACVVSLEVADRTGEMADVVLGFDTLAEYESARNPYFGGIVGRVANRLGGANFELDGRRHVLDPNEGRHHLHGGSRGFDRYLWAARAVRGKSGVNFRRRSPAGESGYPGNLDVRVTYVLGAERTLEIVYDAVSDALTPINLTQHTYFNLAGSGTILGHNLELRANRYVVVDSELIPTGELRGVENTEFDFRSERAIGRVQTSYDICYELAGRYWNTRPVTACRLSDPGSGRVLEIEAMQPGLQLYTGQYLDGLQGKLGRLIPRFGGVCLEAQHFPDSVHHDNFPSTILKPGDHYLRVMRWRFSNT